MITAGRVGQGKVGYGCTLLRKVLKVCFKRNGMSRMTKSAKKILNMLRGRELSQKEIIQKSGLTERAVRYILEDLLNHQLINIRRTPKDKRLKLYSAVDIIF